MKKLLFIGIFSVGSLFAANCTMCHDAGIGGAKKLNTLTQAQIVKDLKSFRAGKGNPMMVGQASGLSDAQIAKYAKEFGKK